MENLAVYKFNSPSICLDATISPDLSNDDVVTEGDIVSLCVIVESEGGTLESSVEVSLISNPGMLEIL